MALTYTQQVAAFRDELAASEAKRAANHTEVMAALADIKAALAPAEPPADQPPVEQPPVVDPTTLTDLSGNVWTLDSSSRTLKNGVIFGGGIGTEYRLKDGNVQVLGSDGLWYQVVGDSWVREDWVTPPTDGTVSPPPPMDTTQPPSGYVVVPGPFDRPRRTVALPGILHGPDELKAGRYVLPFDAKLAISPVVYQTYPRGSWAQVGLTPDMGSTGGRQEIGLVTEAQAGWLCGGAPNNMLVQAEAHADVPVHFGKLDIFVTPWAQTYADDASKGSPYYNVSGYSVRPESAHYPSLSYVPFLATRDIYYLGELQAAGDFVTISGPGLPEYRPLLQGGQPRAAAWSVRTLAECYIATIEAEIEGPLPDGYKPSSYWKKCLDKYRDAITTQYVESTDARVQAFRTIVNDYNYWIAPWEQDYFGEVLGWMVWTGKFEDWRNIYVWAFQQAVRRAPFGARAIGYHWDVKGATDYASLIAANPDVINDTNYIAQYRANCKVAVLNSIDGAGSAFFVADNIQTNWRPYQLAV